MPMTVASKATDRADDPAKRPPPPVMFVPDSPPADQQTQKQANTCGNANGLPRILVDVLVGRGCNFPHLLHGLALGLDKAGLGLLQ